MSINYLYKYFHRGRTKQRRPLTAAATGRQCLNKCNNGNNNDDDEDARKIVKM